MLVYVCYIYQLSRELSAHTVIVLRLVYHMPT